MITIHMMDRAEFVAHDVLKPMCGADDASAYVAVPDKVTCTDCLEKIKQKNAEQTVVK